MTEAHGAAEAHGARAVTRPVCAASEIARGAVRAVSVGGVPVAVVHTGAGEFFAVHDQCTHGMVALSDGEVEGDSIECCMHGSRFDLATGRARNLPATVPVRVYPVEVRDDNIYVNVDQGDIR